MILHIGWIITDSVLVFRYKHEDFSIMYFLAINLCDLSSFNLLKNSNNITMSMRKTLLIIDF